MMTFNDFRPIRELYLFVIFLSFCSLTAQSQVNLSGTLLNHADKKGIPNAIVFFNNATIGTTTDLDGHFVLTDVRPGKYELIATVLGFSYFHQSLTIKDHAVDLGKIELLPSALKIKEVRITNINPVWQRNFQWFRKSFLGTTALANDCKIVNPEILDMRYKSRTDSLIVSTDDFPIIENNALGYRIKYVIDTFVRCDSGKRVHYEGRVLFEEMKGTSAQQKRWAKTRQETYEGSAMHFLRSAMYDRLGDEGFRVLQYSVFSNPNRPADSIILSKIQWFKTNRDKDSLKIWTKKWKSPKILHVLLDSPLTANEIIHHTNEKEILALGCEKDGLFIMYNKGHYFPSKGDLSYLISPYNETGTLITFNALYVFFDLNGWITNPDGMSITGAWARNRVAGLLPTDYDPDK